MNRLILFLIRKKLGVKKYQYFHFLNQRNKNDRYFFTDECILKDTNYFVCKSNLKLNFLLSDEAKELIVMEVKA